MYKIITRGGKTKRDKKQNKTGLQLTFTKHPNEGKGLTGNRTQAGGFKVRSHNH